MTKPKQASKARDAVQHLVAASLQNRQAERALLRVAARAYGLSELAMADEVRRATGAQRCSEIIGRMRARGL